ncbi:MAG TPA: hypothetical protein VGH03_04140 [Caulobacteraceae bacterium]
MARKPFDLGTYVARATRGPGKPGGEALHQRCFSCHQPAEDHDFVFTRYAPTP